jgi:hypothetical protein
MTADDSENDMSKRCLIHSPKSRRSLGSLPQARHAALIACALLLGCGSDEAEPGATSGTGGTGGSGTVGGSGGTAGSGVTGVGVGPCDIVVQASPPASAAHLVACTPVSYDTDPPSGGEHYAIWPAFQSYDFPVPAGFLVHALEHGTVVFWYNCPEGCADEVAEVEAFIASLPEDPECIGMGATRRAILTPSPTLGSRWAASAWGFALSADCFDEGLFREFYVEHYDAGPESLCVAGQAFTEDPCP